MRIRAVGYGALLSVTFGLGLLALFYVIFLPTSDIRTRMYILEDIGSPWLISVLGLGILMVGVVAAWIGGWWSRWSVLGVLTGVALALLVYLTRVMGLYVWLHDEEMTVTGRIVRILAALLLPTVALLLARRASKQVAA